MAFCGQTLTVEKFIQLLADRKTEGNLEKLLLLHLQLANEKYHDTELEKLFHQDAIALLRELILSRISGSIYGGIIEKDCPLRAYYVADYDYVLVGHRFENRCLIPPYIAISIGKYLQKLGIDQSVVIVGS
jgi:hypothetical protein